MFSANYIISPNSLPLSPFSILFSSRWKTLFFIPFFMFVLFFTFPSFHAQFTPFYRDSLPNFYIFYFIIFLFCFEVIFPLALKSSTQSIWRCWSLPERIYTSPTMAMECQQFLPLSVVQLKHKHCQEPHCRNGVVDTIGHC